MKKIKLELNKDQIAILIDHCTTITSGEVDREDWSGKLHKLMIVDLVCELQRKVIGFSKDKYKIGIKPHYGLSFLELTNVTTKWDNLYYRHTIVSIYNTIHQKLISHEK